MSRLEISLVTSLPLMSSSQEEPGGTLEKFTERKKKHCQKNVRSLDTSTTKIRETANVLQRQLHSFSQVSPQRSNQWWCHFQRMVPDSSEHNTLELIDQNSLPKIMCRWHCAQVCTLWQVFWGQQRRTLTPIPINQMYASKRKNLKITQKCKNSGPQIW